MENPSNPRLNKLNSPQKEEKPLRSWLNYAHLGFKMMAAMSVAAWLGVQLDQYWQLKFPLCLCILTLGSTLYTIFATIRSLT